jgi:hypothetical protein
MRIIINNLKESVIITLIVICYHPVIYSQDADSIPVLNKPGFFLGFSIGPGQSLIQNEGTLSISETISTSLQSFSASFETGYFFTKGFGLSTGVGYNSYKTRLSLESYQSTLIGIDSENESYQLRVSASGIKENQEINYITIPFAFNLRLPFGENSGFFIQPGVNLSMPLMKSYAINGMFSYSGYYPSYNVLLENLPEYGFPGNIESESNGEPELKSVVLNVTLSAGFDFFIRHKVQIGVGAFWEKSLTNVSDYSSPTEFQLSSGPGDIKSLMGGCINVTTESLAVKIVLRYFLKYH